MDTAPLPADTVEYRRDGSLEALVGITSDELHAAETEADVLAYQAFPPKHWRQIWSNNPLERPEPRSQAAH